MKAKEIQELIDFISKSGLEEVNIETEEFKIKVRKSSKVETKYIESSNTASSRPGTSIAPQVASQESSEKEPSPQPSPATGNDEAKYIPIKSPMIGTFYRSSSPDVEPFVKVGDKVKAGQPVCIIEAMKLFNEIESEVSGTIVKVLLDNASPVEYDQPLFLVDPS